MSVAGRLRIGEFSRRVGVTPLVLRAWETRYELVEPERTPGGLRLYSEADERRVRAMCRHIDAGLSASEAARLAKLDEEVGDGQATASLAELRVAFGRGVQSLDEPAVQAALDQLVATVGTRLALTELVLPFLREVGDRWATGEVAVAEEHFASNIISGWLRGLAQGWGAGAGPLAVLACPPGEHHELGLLSFGLALRERGWRIAYLGADTPIEAIRDRLPALSASIVILSAVDPQRFVSSAQAIADLATVARVGLGGAGTSSALAEELNAEVLFGDLVEIAGALRP